MFFYVLHQSLLRISPRLQSGFGDSRLPRPDKIPDGLFELSQQALVLVARDPPARSLGSLAQDRIRYVAGHDEPVKCLHAPVLLLPCERTFGTWQNRLPQELRLAGIRGLAGANRFLRERYINTFNGQFARPALTPEQRRAPARKAAAARWRKKEK